jgi:hypothetical protein
MVKMKTMYTAVMHANINADKAFCDHLPGPMKLKRSGSFAFVGCVIMFPEKFRFH